MLRDGRWTHELRDGELVAKCAGSERSVERIADMLAASLALASRPVRLRFALKEADLFALRFE